ncbi:MAG: DUF4236 domain-containing protein [Chloroflexota bacterium]|nr:DUF4236 domain-containing protein [Chloroflexota bacterium]
MPSRFRKSIKIAPGVRLNIGKKRGSITIGKRGSSVNFGSRGVYGNIGVPGTGLSYRSKLGGSSQNLKSNSGKPDNPSQSNKTVISIQISLLEDGSVTFKDENGNLLPDDWVRKAKSQNKQLILDWLYQHCEEKNEEITSLFNIHLTTPSPDTQISFTPSPFDIEIPSPPDNEFSDPRPIPLEKKDYGFLGSNIAFLRKSIDKKNKKLENRYQEELQNWELAKENFEEQYQIKHQEYLDKLEEFNKNKRNYALEQEDRRKFIEEDRFVEIDAMYEFLEEVLQTIVWPKETVLSFDIINEGTKVLMDVHLPEIEEMPEIQTKVNKRDYKLTLVQISDTQKRKNYISHIHSIGFRLIGEVFVSLPSVKNIVFSGYTHRISKSTGNLTSEYLYSVKTTRDEWEKLNFQNLEMIDVLLCFEEFDLRRNATKTGIMKAIKPFKE